MATELSISIVATAAIGGALKALTGLSGSVKSLKSATAIATNEHKQLGRQIDRAMTKGHSDVGRLIGQYYKLGDSIKRVNQTTKLRTTIDAKIENGRKTRSVLVGEAMDLVGLGATVALPIKLAIDFESSMADVKKVVDFDTPQQFAQMNEDILKLTHSIPMAGSEIAAIVAAGGQSGVARENLLGFATNAAKMGVAFDMAAGDAGKSMATLSNVLKIPIEDIDRLGDAINHLSDNANSNAADIVNVLTRVGGTATQLKLTENQAAALGSTFLSMGKPPELAAQAMEGMLSQMAMMKTGHYDKDLAKLGYSTGEFARAMNEDAQSAITQFLQKVKELPEDDQYPFLTELFGKNYNDDVLLLASSVGEYGRQLDLLSEKDPSGNLAYLGSMSREFENRSATTANQIQLLKNQLVHLGVNIGSVVLPAITSIIKSVSPLVARLGDWAAANPNLIKGIITVAGALFAFRASSILVRLVLNSLGLSIFSSARQLVGFYGILQKLRLAGALFSMGKATAALRVFGLSARQAKVGADIIGKSLLLARSGVGAFANTFSRLGSLSSVFHVLRVAVMGFGKALLTTPIGWIGMAIAGTAFLIYKYWTPISSFFMGLWDGIKAGFAPLMTLFADMGGQLSAIFTPVIAILGGLWTSIAPLVQPIIDWLGEFFSQSQMAGDGARSMGQMVGAAIMAILTAVVSIASGIISVWTTTLSALFTFAGTCWTAIKTIFVAAITAVRAILAGANPVSALQSAFAPVFGYFGSLMARFKAFGANIIEGLIGGILSKIGSVVSAVSRVGSAVKSAITGRGAGGMDIHSPSRVFRAYGGFIGEGLGIGIGESKSTPINAIGKMATGIKTNFGAKMGSLSADVSASVSAHHARMSGTEGGTSTGNITINYSPTINASGTPIGKIETALQFSQREFEKMFARMQADRLRRAY